MEILKILLVEDDPSMRDSIQSALKGQGRRVYSFSSAEEAIETFSRESFHVVITDYKLPDKDGIFLLEQIKRISQDTPVILITAYPTYPRSVEAIKKGAEDFLVKPFALEELESVVNRALEHRRLQSENEYLRTRLRDSEREYIWGPSRLMKELYEKIQRIAQTESTVLIMGETGTGKEVVAQSIHLLSRRSKGPFLCVNCAALSSGLLESELFGHEKGAFTGADRTRKGRFEIAEGGTLLLDEISEIDLALQAKLLRVLQEKKFERVGSSHPRYADVRILATTNKNLKEAVEKGLFREDLYYRLNVVPLYVPPLREHKEDIPQLAEHFLRRFIPAKTPVLPADVLELFYSYNWPGNIRELANIIERALVLSPDGKLSAGLIAPWLCSEAPERSMIYEALVNLPMEKIEENVILANLRYFKGNKEKAANALGISSRTLRDKLKKLSKDVKEFPEDG
jgi:DNA-binding NtrC family response regulator